MAFPIIPIIMAAAAIGSSIIASRSSKKQAQKTAAANMELAKYQSSANEAFIDKQNAYNTPAMQMSRYDVAGLNPNLAYGQGTPGNQAQPARYEAPTVDYHFQPFQIPEVLSSFQDYEMRAAQIDNVKAGTENVRTEIGNKLLDRMLTSVNTSRKRFDLDQAKILAPYNQDIRHGQANSAHAKMMQELLKVDTVRLANQLRSQQLSKGEVGIDIAKQDLLYKQLKNQMFKNQGLTPTDNVLLRLMVKAFSNMDIRLNRDQIDRDLKIRGGRGAQTSW